MSATWQKRACNRQNGNPVIVAILKTLTTDNGSEFACHELITKKIGAKVYFADPYSSWQKSAVENINKLIRQYVKKGSDFDQYEKQTQMKINKRPRKKLGFEAPIIVFQRLMKKVALAELFSPQKIFANIL